MKICIYGAGAIGGYLGAELALAGYDVTMIARGLQQLPWVQGCRIVSVDRFGFDMVCHGGAQRRATRVGLRAPALTREQFENEFRKLTGSAPANA